VVAVTLMIAGTAVGSAGPAAAAPTDGGSGAITDAAVSPLNEFMSTTLFNDQNNPPDITVDPIKFDTSCVTLDGTVTPEDIATALDGRPQPEGKGKWVYVLCAQTKKLAQDAVTAIQEQGGDLIANAKAYCPTGKDEKGNDRAGPNQCVLVAEWDGEQKPAPPAVNDDRDSYLKSFLKFAPDLGSSPVQDADHAAIANLPTWFWNKVETRFPKAVTNFALIGDFAFATAWHLNTTFTTNDNPSEACDVSGLQKVGIEWNRSYPPGAESQSDPKCGHTYHNIGTYNVHGCTQWLIIAFIPPFFVVAFPITVCDDFTVRVREAQVVTSNEGPRGRVS
jgi:hypothetical protein